MVTEGDGDPHGGAAGRTQPGNLLGRSLRRGPAGLHRRPLAPGGLARKGDRGGEAFWQLAPSCRVVSSKRMWGVGLHTAGRLPTHSGVH